jgi:hypothetical protein
VSIRADIPSRSTDLPALTTRQQTKSCDDSSLQISSISDDSPDIIKKKKIHPLCILYPDIQNKNNKPCNLSFVVICYEVITKAIKNGISCLLTALLIYNLNTMKAILVFSSNVL